MLKRICASLARAISVGIVVFAATQAFAADDGQAIFAQNCAACHQPTGKGIPGAYPALAGGKIATGPQAVPVDRVLSGHGGMPSFRNALSNTQISAVLNYVRSSFGNHAAPISSEFVAIARGGRQSDPPPPQMPAH